MAIVGGSDKLMIDGEFNTNVGGKTPRRGVKFVVSAVK